MRRRPVSDVLPETFEILCFEMFQQTVVGGIGREYPVFHFKGKETWTEGFFETFLIITLDQNFLREKLLSSLSI